MRLLYLHIGDLPRVRRQIIKLSINVFSGKEIAEKLGISVNTVKVQKNNIEMPDMERGWISLGHFQLSPGKVVVTLTDKGSVDGQIIYADAIKCFSVDMQE